MKYVVNVTVDRDLFDDILFAEGEAVSVFQPGQVPAAPRQERVEAQDLPALVQQAFAKM
jgi:hypothetical protein